jgi:acetyl-CoA carboxylase biotin carboxyl carrier protein
MDLKEIQELIRMMSKSGLAELKLKNGDFELVLRSESTKEKVIMQSMQAPMVSMPAPMAAPVSTAGDKKSTVGTEVTSDSKPVASYLEIKSPMVGTFYRSASPDKPPYIKVGDTVSSGQPVCMVEAMKLFNEIESEISGTVIKIMVEDAAPVEYDQVLFLIEPA